MGDGWIDPNDDYQVIRRQMMTDTQVMREQFIDGMGSNVIISLAVAEFVMGWVEPRVNFATDGKSALELILPRMQDQLGFTFQLTRGTGRDFVAMFSQCAVGDVYATDQLAARAICRAALKAALRWKVRHPMLWRPSLIPR